MQDLYKTLGVASDADAQAIRQAYLKLAGQFHPDRNPENPNAAEQFKAVQAAYEVLSDPEKRQEYDLLRGFQEFIKSDEGAQAVNNAFRKAHERKFREWVASEVAENQTLVNTVLGNKLYVNRTKLAEILNQKLETVIHNFEVAGPEILQRNRLLLEPILQSYLYVACYCSESDFTKIADKLKSKAHGFDLWSSTLDSTLLEARSINLSSNRARAQSAPFNQSSSQTTTPATKSDLDFIRQAGKWFLIIVFFLVAVRTCKKCTGESNQSGTPTTSSPEYQSNPSADYQSSDNYNSYKYDNVQPESPAVAPPPPPPDPCDDPNYYKNRLQTGAMPYENRAKWGAYDGNSQNKIRFKTEIGKDYLVLLVNVYNKQVVRQTYIQGGESYTMSNMAPGAYFIMFMSGNGWNPTCPVNAELRGGFAQKRAFQAADRASDHLVINPPLGQYITYEVTLYGVVDGNMQTHPISADSFQ